MSFFNELKRRNVLRAALAYLAGAWLLIQIVETLFPVFGLSDGAIRAVVIVLAVGFPVTIVLAWVFEWSPQGLVRDNSVVEPSNVAANRRIDRIIIAILILALGLFAIDRFILDPARDAQEIAVATETARAGALKDAFGDKSIAVLPFDNLSSDPEQGYLADGLAEELLNLLARIQGLRVTSRTSAFKFKGSEASLPEIAKQLDVANILEGSVRRSGDTIRITVQLIDARADAHLWSETYERPLNDIFLIQDQVAASVVEQLQIAMDLSVPTVARHNPEAYTLYLQASHLFENGGSEVHQRVEELLTRAIKMDSEFTDAWVELAWLYSVMFSDRPEEQVPRVMTALESAAATDPDNARLNAAQAWFALTVGDDLAAAAMHEERALRSDPYNDDVLNMTMVLEQTLGRIGSRRQIGAYLTRVDPLNYWAHLHFAAALEANGQFEKALVETRTAASLRPEEPAAQWKLGLALLQTGQPEAALEQFEKASADTSYYHHGRALALHDLGRDDESAAELAELHQVEDRLFAETGASWDMGFARAYAWLGDAERALQYFEKAQTGSPNAFLGEEKNPMFGRIEDDPRWQAMLEQVRARQAAIEFNPRLPPEILAIEPQ